jgi:hypothetical protein
LLTPNCFDRCSDPEDWVRQEFETAVKHGRNIVPVRGSSLDISQLRQASPTSMAHAFDYQAASLRHDAFDQDVERLVNHLIPAHRAPNEAAKVFSVEVPPPRSECKADISRIIKYAPPELIGRDTELQLLNQAWDKAVSGEPKRPHILTFVALGGEGKTSLVSKWAAELAHQEWAGCEAAFAWSFYSQGTSEKTQASSDTFLRDALIFFGDEETANSAKHAVDKAKKLAALVGQRRSLLILDGLEPLQYAPTSPTRSELKDQGVSALLKALATTNQGLCVLTTRYSIPDLRNFWQSTAPEIKLASLSNEAGVALLRSLGVKGTQKEFEKLVTDVRGHALTLNLLGSFLRDAHAGDIRKRDLVNSFKKEGEKGARALSILRLLGLFDRPATVDCLSALWTGEEIGGLTGPLIGLSDAQRNIVLKRLEDARLITVNREHGSDRLVSLDAHPLIREYFAARVRMQLPGAWRAAHRRLYEHLRDTTREGDQPTLEDLQPLYQAVAHGCQAGLQQEACESLYYGRIARKDEHYSALKLSAFGSDLGAEACFFIQPWSRLSPALGEDWQAWMLNEAAFRLRALGRLTEAVEPMRTGLEMRTQQEKWEQAAISASNLSELELTLGEVVTAWRDAEQSVTYADRSEDAFWKMGTRTTHADAAHQAGRRAEAKTLFVEAEQMQKKGQPDYPLLYSLQGFRYCDLLLVYPERAAWKSMFPGAGLSPVIHAQDVRTDCHVVSQRAAETLKWVTGKLGLLDEALDHLTLGRAALYAAVLEGSGFRLLNSDTSHIDDAVSVLRRSGNMDDLPRGLLTRAWLRFLIGPRTGVESAQEDLDEAWEIAERGPMRLHMADIHLYRARLFHAVRPYPWNKFEDGTEGRGPKDDLADARKLIERCGYWRRKEELEDAEEAAKNWA